MKDDIKRVHKNTSTVKYAYCETPKVILCMAYEESDAFLLGPKVMEKKMDKIKVKVKISIKIKVRIMSGRSRGWGGIMVENVMK